MWNQLTEKHPSFQDPDNVVKLTSRGLKALIDQAYEEGYDNGSKEDYTPNKDGFDILGMFNEMFGGK